MKKLAICAFALVSAVVLNSCGNCNCNSYNSDYLRDVPTSSSRYFY